MYGDSDICRLQIITQIFRRILKMSAKIIYGNVELVIQETPELERSVASDLQREDERSDDERERAITSNTVRS